MMEASNLILPLLIFGILLYGVFKGVDVYGEFVEGALEGAKSAVRIFPYILAIIFAINLFVRSGAENFIVKLLGPLTSKIGFPPELLSLSIVKPLSGGGSIGVFETMLKNFGPDSFVGRSASVLMGSSETIFYTAAVYFGSVGIKNMRYVIKVGLIAHVASIFASIVVTKLLF